MVAAAAIVALSTDLVDLAVDHPIRNAGPSTVKRPVPVTAQYLLGSPRATSSR
jgi:hypothetical protein